MINAQVIRDLPSTELTYASGPLDVVAEKVLPPEVADDKSLAFVSKAHQLELALKARSPIIVAHKSLSLPGEGATFFTTSSIQMAMSQLLPLFDGKMNRFNQESKIHPTASIHPSAHLGKNVGVGPFVVIGERVQIGDGATIGAHTVIECDSLVGDHSLLHSHVFVGAHCEIGSRCEIHPHTTIGSDGFSFVPDKNGHFKKIPQLGRVVIGHDVEIGANCAIDRAALTETRIGDGTKMDNLCHIAHNVQIGKHCVIAGKFSVAGSSKIGDHFMCGGEVAVADHITICDHVVLAGRSSATKNITSPGQYGGYPLEPLGDAMKTRANIAHITKMRKNLARVLKHLGLDDQ